jgi:hypothetical protein
MYRHGELIGGSHLLFALMMVVRRKSVWASAATTYVKVVNGSTELRARQPPARRTSIYTHYDSMQDDAPPGGDGSAAAPFQTIQQGIDRAGPGTQVLVADGVYREMVIFPVSGSINQWIQVKAEGSGAILDGSEHRTGKIWTPHPTRARVWFMSLGSPMVYLARDGQRYKYDDLAVIADSKPWW